MNYSFTRYLAAKKTIDDRSLNRVVWDVLARQLHRRPTPLHVLEVGAGTGVMLERMLEWGLLTQVDYTGITVNLSNFVPVPEPSTWILLLTGSLLVTFQLRRRR